MSISDSLATAHANLLRVIPKPLTVEEEVEEQSKGRRRPTANPTALHEAARCFADALSRNPAAAAELKRRGTLVAVLTGEGSKYLTAKKKARQALSMWKPKELILQRLVNHFQSEGGRELVADVRHEHERLCQLLDGFPVPDATRPLLETWRDAAWPIVSAGENDSLDGCYWLLHMENLGHELFAVGAAPEIRQAADAMVAWCKEQTDAGNGGKGTASQTTRWERLNKWAGDNWFVLTFLTISAVVVGLSTLGSGLETLFNWMRRFIVWLWP
jgi:hypothetical protein